MFEVPARFLQHYSLSVICSSCLDRDQVIFLLRVVVGGERFRRGAIIGLSGNLHPHTLSRDYNANAVTHRYAKISFIIDFKKFTVNRCFGMSLRA